MQNKTGLDAQTQVVAAAAEYRYHLMVQERQTKLIHTMTALGPENADLRRGAEIAFPMEGKDGKPTVFEATVVRVDRERIRRAM